MDSHYGQECADEECGPAARPHAVLLQGEGQGLHNRQHLLVREDYSIARPADFAGHPPAGFETLLAAADGARCSACELLGHMVDAAKRGISHAENGGLAIEWIYRRVRLPPNAQLGIGADDIHHVDQAVGGEQRHGLSTPAGCQRRARGMGGASWGCMGWTPDLRWDFSAKCRKT